MFMMCPRSEIDMVWDSGPIDLPAVASMKMYHKDGRLSSSLRGGGKCSTIYNPHLCIDWSTSKLTNDDLFVTTIITCITRIEEEEMKI